MSTGLIRVFLYSLSGFMFERLACCGLFNISLRLVSWRVEAVIQLQLTECVCLQLSIDTEHRESLQC